MARVTVEDCVLKVPNRFDLVMLAAQRARDVSSGAPLTLDRDNDKNPVVALREIADETIDLEVLANSLVQGLQRHVEVDEPEEDTPLFGVANEGAEAGVAPDALAGGGRFEDATEEEAADEAAEAGPGAAFDEDGAGAAQAEDGGDEERP